MGKKKNKKKQNGVDENELQKNGDVFNDSYYIIN